MEGECCQWRSMNNNFIQYGKYSAFTVNTCFNLISLFMISCILELISEVILRKH